MSRGAYSAWAPGDMIYNIRWKNFNFTATRLTQLDEHRTPGGRAHAVGSAPAGPKLRVFKWLMRRCWLYVICKRFNLLDFSNKDERSRHRLTALVHIKLYGAWNNPHTADWLTPPLESSIAWSARKLNSGYAKAPRLLGCDKYSARCKKKRFSFTLY